MLLLAQQDQQGWCIKQGQHRQGQQLLYLAWQVAVCAAGTPGEMLFKPLRESDRDLGSEFSN